MRTPIFLEHLSEAKEYLQQEGGEDFKTICLLTAGMEKKDSHKEHAERYSAMWKSLARRTPTYEKQDCHWVLWFVRAVTKARQTPSFRHKNATDRQDIIRKIKKHTKALTDLYRQNELDAHYVYNKDAFLDGYFIYEDLDEIFQAHVDTCLYNRCPTRGCHHNHCKFEDCEENGCPPGGGSNERIAFTKIIQTFAERAIANIENVSHHGKFDDGAKIRHFIRSLARETEGNYGKPPYTAFSSAVFAVYGKEYPPGQIVNLLKQKPIQSGIRNLLD